MADQIMGVTETSAAAMDLIANFVQEALIGESVLAPVVQQVLAPVGAQQVEVPRSDNPTVGTKAENASAEAQVLTYATDVIPLNLHKYVQYLVEDISLVQTNIALIEDLMMKAAKALAYDLDDEIYSQLKLASSSSPDHRVAYQSGSAMTAADITNANKLLNIQNVPKGDRFLIVNPTQEKSLLDIAQFVQADSYGSNGGLANGELGRLYGFTVLVSNVVDTDEAVAFHRSAVAVGRQVMPKVEKQRDLANLADRLSISHLFGCKVLDSGKRCVKIGTAT